MSTTAQIAAKGCQNTGITEELAKRLHDNLGKTIVAIVELTADARTENRDGDEKVKLSIGTIEVAPDGDAAEHVRELARLFHYERGLTEDGDTLDYDGDGPAPKVADVLAHGQRFKPHPYLASTLSTDDQPVCDVCGHHEGAAVHADRTALADPFAVDADTDQDDTDPDPDDPTYDTHDYIDDGDGTCLECDQPETSAVHTTTPAVPAGT